jgi:hypothetical protein
MLESFQGTKTTTTTLTTTLCSHRHFLATCEAIKNITSTEDLTPEIFLEAMKTCHGEMDLKSARELMDLAVVDGVVRPSLGTYLILVR